MQRDRPSDPKEATRLDISLLRYSDPEARMLRYSNSLAGESSLILRSGGEDAMIFGSGVDKSGNLVGLDP
jgi:hypothetical protein